MLSKFQQQDQTNPASSAVQLAFGADSGWPRLPYTYMYMPSSVVPCCEKEPSALTSLSWRI